MDYNMVCFEIEKQRYINHSLFMEVGNLSRLCIQLQKEIYDIRKQLAKKQVCTYWLEGRCDKGDKCHYLHKKID